MRIAGTTSATLDAGFPKVLTIDHLCRVRRRQNPKATSKPVANLREHGARENFIGRQTEKIHCKRGHR